MSRPPSRARHPGDLDPFLQLIVITDRHRAAPGSVEDVVREALDAGARTVQLRDKEAPARSLLAQARRLRALTEEHDALLFVNDRMDVALAAEADGVHLGPDDIPVSAARASAPTGFLIGSSTDDPDEARRLEAAGADYIGCGTVYPTGSKADAGEVIGPEGLRRVVEAVSIPVVGIGGIMPDRAGEVVATGAVGCASIGAVMGAEAPGSAVRTFLTPWS